MFGVLYVRAKDLDGADVLVGYPAVVVSTHYGAHGISNRGPSQVEILSGRLKGRTFTPVFIEPNALPTGDEQFAPLTAMPPVMYYGPTR